MVVILLDWGFGRFGHLGPPTSHIAQETVTPRAAVAHLLSMASDRYFTSQEPLTGDPPLLWDDFRYPRLRRFPQPVEDLVLGRYLGCGIDGLVFKARLRCQREPLAVKIVIKTSIALTLIRPGLTPHRL